MARSLSSRIWIGQAFAVAVICTTFWSGWAQAAGCYDGSQQLSPQKIAEFTANPSQILSQNTEGGAMLVSEVRDLAASDQATLALIMGLVPDANREQKRAIGAGLAQAARICVRGDQAYAGRIQQAIADTRDPELQLAYAAASGDQPIGAGGAGAGAGSSGGVGGATSTATTGSGGGGSAEGIGGNGVGTGSFGISANAGAANSVSQ